MERDNKKGLQARSEGGAEAEGVLEASLRVRGTLVMVSNLHHWQGVSGKNQGFYWKMLLEMDMAMALYRLLKK